MWLSWTKHEGGTQDIVKNKQGGFAPYSLYFHKYVTFVYINMLTMEKLMTYFSLYIFMCELDWSHTGYSKTSKMSWPLC